MQGLDQNPIPQNTLALRGSPVTVQLSWRFKPAYIVQEKLRTKFRFELIGALQKKKYFI